MFIINFIGDCILVFIKSCIGCFLVIAAMYLISLIVNPLRDKIENKRPKYKGQPIVVQGGKENEKK